MIEELPEPANKNSMLYWYPKLEKLNILMPKTEFVNLEPIGKGRYGDCPVTWDTEEVKSAIKNVGGYPAFIRTDQASDKHNMNNASKISNLDEIDEHIREVISFNQMAGIAGLAYKVLAVREWINIQHEFRAFRGNMKIGVEMRFFIRDGKLECWHYYWPEGSIQRPNKSDWAHDLREMNTEAHQLWRMVRKDVTDISNGFEGWWSVDAAYTEDSVWYIIDMAKGEDSYHNPECKHCPDEIKKRYGNKDEDNDRIDEYKQLLEDR